MSGSPIDEEWRDVPGWIGRCQVSSLGRMRTRHLGALPGSADYWFIRKPGKGRHYLQLSLPKLAGETRQRSVMVHKLIAETFLGPRPEHAVIRHIDGNRFNNAVTNLAYGTDAENRADDVAQGKRRGTNNGRARLTEREALAIKRLLAEGVQSRALARAFDVHENTIYWIKRGRNWAHLC